MRYVTLRNSSSEIKVFGHIGISIRKFFVITEIGISKVGSIYSVQLDREAQKVTIGIN